MNYVNRMDELHQRRGAERPIVEDAMRWCHQQHDQGHLYLIENPEKSRLWEEPWVLNLIQSTNGMTVTCHSGAYGATGSKGNLIRKTFKFASNSKEILALLQDKLSPDQLLLCKPLEGKEVALSQNYPEKLVRAILKGLKTVAKLRHPTRFKPYAAFASYTMPSEDRDAWGKVLDEASDHLENNNVTNLILDPAQNLYQNIQALRP